jgi:nicotinate-nucleotide adenylyltransferase
VSLGILGGTFDPIHVGHLRAAENAREGLGLERVLFVTASSPPHRPPPAASALDRYAMVCLATAGHPAFAACDVEVARPGTSYTADTLEHLAGRHPGERLVLIVGSDTFPDVVTWRRSHEIFARCALGVVERPGEPSAPDAAAPGASVERASGPGLEVSASVVRERLRQGRSVRYLVPEAVADYITKRGLYR